MVPASRVSALVASVAIVVTSTACGERRAPDAGIETRVRGLEARVDAIEKDRKSAVDALAAAGPAASAARPATTDRARRTIEALRAQSVSFDFTNADVAMVLAAIFDMTNVDRVLSAAASGVHTPITLKLGSSSAYDALDSIAASSALRWTVDDGGIVRIKTADDRSER